MNNRDISRKLHVVAMHAMEVDIMIGPLEPRWKKVQEVILLMNRVINEVDEVDLDTLSPSAKVTYGWLCKQREILSNAHIPAVQLDKYLEDLEECAND